MAALAALAGGICLAVCQWLIYAYAPVESSMGEIQKIFYLHLPLAWWGLISFFMVFVSSIAYLVKRSPGWDNLAWACAELGLLFCGLALVSGMIWARISWGVWWTWDPRLTTTLVMWFIYAAYFITRHLDLPLDRRRLISAVVGVIAFLDVPLVFFSARIFRSIHPAVFASKGGGLEPEMLHVLLACIGALGLFWLALLLMRKAQLDMAQILGRARFSMLAADGDSD